MWDILPICEEEAREHWRTKLVRLQTVCMGTRGTRLTLHEVPMDLTEEQVEVSFPQFGQVGDVSAASSKAGIAT